MTEKEIVQALRCSGCDRAFDRRECGAAGEGAAVDQREGRG